VPKKVASPKHLLPENCCVAFKVIKVREKGRTKEAMTKKGHQYFGK
jgi:hypothetical protein